MAESSLGGRQVLVAEDEYIIAEGLRQTLEDAGATVVGPAPSVARALALIQAGPVIDAAVLDLNLNGEMAFPVADALAERGIPFVITTGYEEGSLPQRYSHVSRCQKPVEPTELTRALSHALRG